MMFTTFEGKRLLVIHHAEGDGPRKPRLYEIQMIRVIDWFLVQGIIRSPMKVV